MYVIATNTRGANDKKHRINTIVLFILPLANNKSIVAAPIITQQTNSIEHSRIKLLSSSFDTFELLLSSAILPTYSSRSNGNNPYNKFKMSHKIDDPTHFRNSVKVRFILQSRSY